jgi:hypothetical protein
MAGAATLLPDPATLGAAGEPEAEQQQAQNCGAALNHGVSLANGGAHREDERAHVGAGESHSITRMPGTSQPKPAAQQRIHQAVALHRSGRCTRPAPCRSSSRSTGMQSAAGAFEDFLGPLLAALRDVAVPEQNCAVEARDQRGDLATKRGRS